MKDLKVLNEVELSTVVGGGAVDWNQVGRNARCWGGTLAGALLGGLASGGSPIGEVGGALSGYANFCY